MATGFKQATVNASDVPATLTDYPAYVDLSRLGITTQSEADSVRCYSDASKTTELAREIVSVSEMWVKISSLTNSFTLYVDWDDTSSDYADSATYGRDNVWSDYILVSHAGGNINSTGGGNGTENGGLTTGDATGPIGDATTYDGGDSVSWADNTLGEEGSHNDFVVTGWIKSATYPASTVNTMWGKVGSGSDIAGFLGVKSNNTVYCGLGATDTSWYANEYTPGTTISDDTWGKITMIATTSNIDIFLNNSSSLKNTSVSSETWVRNANEPMYLGYSSRYGANGRLTGDLAEVKIRTASGYTTNWLTTEYNNESDESGFWGTWTDASGGGGGSAFSQAIIIS